MDAGSPIYLLSNLGHAASALICIVGLVLAVKHWARHPRASLWAAIGFGLLLISQIAGVGFYTLLSVIVENFGGRSSLVEIDLGLNFIIGLLAAAGLGFLVAALFGKHSNEPRN